MSVTIAKYACIIALPRNRLTLRFYSFILRVYNLYKIFQQTVTKCPLFFLSSLTYWRKLVSFEGKLFIFTWGGLTHSFRKLLPALNKTPFSNCYYKCFRSSRSVISWRRMLYVKGAQCCFTIVNKDRERFEKIVFMTSSDGPVLSTRVQNGQFYTLFMHSIYYFLYLHKLGTPVTCDTLVGNDYGNKRS